jgi:hypothetical protein
MCINKVIVSISKTISYAEIVSLILFLALLPLVNQVNFMQNDDWNRTTSVGRFLQGDFSLLPVTATTFYSQGLLGVAFAALFGVARLPVLTLIVSVLCLYVFAKMLRGAFHLTKTTSVLVSLLLFFNPLFIYSAIGFMTENYLLLFVLLAIYFVTRFAKTSEPVYLVISNVFSFVAFMAKQSGIVLMVALVPYLFFQGKKKLAAIQAVVASVILVCYYIIFPQTNEMHSKSFIFHHILELNYSYSLIYGIALMLVAFTLPLVVYFIGKVLYQTRSRIAILTAVLVAATALFTGLNHYFKPGEISWEEFPYFENTFERTGFLPRTVLGTKYQFMWNYDIYRYWDLSAKIALAVLIPCLFLYRRRIVNLYSISIVLYLALMIFVETFFDRYILLLIPFTLLFLFSLLDQNDQSIVGVTNPLFILPTGLFIIFTTLFSTEMAADFIVAHNYIWTKSSELVAQGVSPDQIQGGGAWGKLHGNSYIAGTLSEAEYIFSYDSPQKNQELTQTYRLVETRKITFPFNWFIDPVVFLYQRK